LLPVPLPRSEDRRKWLELCEVITQLANIKFKEDDFEAAENLYKESLALHERNQRPHEAEVAGAQQNLAYLYFRTVSAARSNPALHLPTTKDRLVSAAPVEDDSSFELKLRPQRLQEFIGQNKVKENLDVAIQAAKSRGEALDHVLLYGPPGWARLRSPTSLPMNWGRLFSRLQGLRLQIKGDLTAILTNLRDRQVLFIDEVHRLQPALEEILYSALEDYKLDIMIGQGPSARTHTMDVKPFTFIGATTRAGLLSAPLRSRFGLLLRLEFYTHDDSARDC
jgi:hypothetical protein